MNNEHQPSMMALVKILAVLLIIIAVIFLIFRKDIPMGMTPDTSGPKEIANVNYVCNEGKTINAVLYESDDVVTVAPGEMPIPTGSAKVVLSDGRTLNLNQTISADGIRYASADESFVFWSKGNTALVLENNEEKSYINCVEKDSQSLGEKYNNQSMGISLEYPKGYTVDENYSYQALGPGKEIKGVKFTIPESFTAGTNLSKDSYISVEQIPLANNQTCNADLFTDRGLTGGSKVLPADENGVVYSYATGTGAGAGNRYEESVYARVGSNPCTAIRYFIHYGAIGNYPEGTVKEFDRAQLISAFDQIRGSMTLNK